MTLTQLAVTVAVLGVPLILQGDEFGRSKSGAAGQAEALNTYNYESATGDASIDLVSWIVWETRPNGSSA